MKNFSLFKKNLKLRMQMFSKSPRAMKKAKSKINGYQTNIEQKKK